MPYIPPLERDRLQTDVEKNCGELNYSITKLVDTYIKTKGLSYQTINDIMGALEGAKLEFYRRVALPYEDSKITINGDVYTKSRKK